MLFCLMICSLQSKTVPFGDRDSVKPDACTTQLFSRNQCDQIWRNFVACGSLKNIIQTSQGLLYAWQILKPTLAILNFLGKLEYCEEPNNAK